MSHVEPAEILEILLTTGCTLHRPHCFERRHMNLVAAELRDDGVA